METRESTKEYNRLKSKFGLKGNLQPGDLIKASNNYKPKNKIMPGSLLRQKAGELAQGKLKGKALSEALAKSLNAPDTKANQKLITKKK